MGSSKKYKIKIIHILRHCPVPFCKTVFILQIEIWYKWYIPYLTRMRHMIICLSSYNKDFFFPYIHIYIYIYHI